MVVKTCSEYINDQLILRIKELQKALYKAESLITIMEQENQRLKNTLSSLDLMHTE